MLAGILLGIESGIPEDVAEAFIATGTSHIIVISGFNFAIIAALLAAASGRWLGRWWGMIVALVGIVLYAVFVGGSAAVVRAAIMGGFALLLSGIDAAFLDDLGEDGNLFCYQFSILPTVVVQTPQSAGYLTRTISSV